MTNCLEPFDVKDCTGPAAGKTLCYYCRYGLRPVVCVFVDEIDDATERLIVKVDELVAVHRDERWAAFVVLLAEDTQATERRLKDLAARRNIQHTPLTIYRDTPQKLRENLRVSPDARLTIRCWNRGEVVAQRETVKQLDDGEITQIISVLGKSVGQ